MTVFLIFLVSLIAVCAVAFVTWFFAMKADGKCPLCMLKALGRSKLTIDVKGEKNYENNVDAAPIMGWSSWNTLRNHIDEDSIYETARVMV